MCSAWLLELPSVQAWLVFAWEVFLVGTLLVLNFDELDQLEFSDARFQYNRYFCHFLTKVLSEFRPLRKSRFLRTFDKFWHFRRFQKGPTIGSKGF